MANGNRGKTNMRINQYLPIEESQLDIKTIEKT